MRMHKCVIKCGMSCTLENLPLLMIYLSLSLYLFTSGTLFLSSLVFLSLQFSVRYPVSTEDGASAGTSAGARRTPRGSFATCRPRLPPDPLLTATRMPTRGQNLPPTPCTLYHCPISKVIQREGSLYPLLSICKPFLFCRLVYALKEEGKFSL